MMNSKKLFLCTLIVAVVDVWGAAINPGTSLVN
jgi:hypothetical protein